MDPALDASDVRLLILTELGSFFFRASRDYWS